MAGGAQGKLANTVHFPVEMVSPEANMQGPALLCLELAS